MDGNEPNIPILLSPGGLLAYRDTVGTGQIDPAAVTDIFSAAATNVDAFTSVVISPPNTLIASISTPGYGFATEIIVTATGHVDHYAPGAQFDTSAGISDFSGSNIYGTAVARNASTASPDAKNSFAIEKRYPSPQTLRRRSTLRLLGRRRLHPGAYGRFNDVLLKAEVIKR